MRTNDPTDEVGIPHVASWTGRRQSARHSPMSARMMSRIIEDNATNDKRVMLGSVLAASQRPIVTCAFCALWVSAMLVC
jgi:hypothetical protein